MVHHAMLKLYSGGRAPSLVPPILAREVRSVPRGEDWIYEFWWGGERARAVKRDGGVHLVSRDGRDFTNRFPRIAASVARLRADDIVIDGEILYLDSYPEPVVRFLTDATDEPLRGSLAFVAFDLLWESARDLRGQSLLCRRLLLASAIQGTPLLLSPLIEAQSETALAAAARLGFRGVVAKRAGSAYLPNSLSLDWLRFTFAPRSADAGPVRRHSAFDRLRGLPLPSTL